MGTAVWRRFINTESAGGVMLAAAAVAALLIANSPWQPVYEAFLSFSGWGGPGLLLSKPLTFWVNDLWMALFFLTVGIEIKRELRVGELNSPRRALMPAWAALGGMVVPSLVYAFVNRADPVALRGWAIPSATDIAFALGILTLLGPRVPRSLKVFLAAVAIIDDLGAILIIALFYSGPLSLHMLGAAALGVALLWLLNWKGVASAWPYLAVGLAIWVCVLQSGIHPTLAGVATALAIPLRSQDGRLPAQELERALHPWVAYLVLPMFAFVNAGVSLQGVAFSSLLHQTIPLGIVAGLVFGKALGVFLASWLAVRFTGAAFPSGASRWQFFGTCMLCGVGFTMSLFIGGLAFDGQGRDHETQLKLGVLAGSLVSAVLGSVVLWMAAAPGVLSERPAGGTGTASGRSMRSPGPRTGR